MTRWTMKKQGKKGLVGCAGFAALAVEMLPPGSKPSQSEQVARAPGMAGREMTVSAEVVAVDPASNHVTFKGPDGNVQTIAVHDPAMQQKLPNIKPGQVIQFTYT